ncbi:uncharacterized protein LOC129592795 [Paramacrobiotus metropolitanus]|uniref:uncharacterized protein LOC129592795 n=1 Tax=Paramacrobiotus metropolitanus TaxID=2943436 RepID=UPI002445EFB4|nr:uncharacterized protein LOC129592795 [Paramacrobiotus metropolitanus]
MNGITLLFAALLVGCCLISAINAKQAVDCMQAQSRAPKSSLWIPQCDAQGAYQITQCNRKKECWCVSPSGQRLGPVWGRYKMPRLTDDPTWMPTDSKAPRPTCEMVNEMWARQTPLLRQR